MGNDTRTRLAPTVSFRSLGGFVVLVDHRSHRILRLSAAAGRLLDALESGRPPGTEDTTLSFLEQLASRGLLEGTVPDSGKPSAARAAATGSVLERINADAAAAHIPLHAGLEVTYCCPLSCRHCYVTPGASDSRELSLPEIENLLDQLAALGTLFLLLTGGEPFSRPDLDWIYDAARDRRFAVSILTSGFGAGQDLLRHMAARGLDAIQVSLHGPSAATHDRVTGVPGSFDAALSCLRRCRDLGLRTRAGVTVTRENEGDLDSIKGLLDAEAIPVALGLFLEPRRNGDREPTDLRIDEAGVRRALELFPPQSAARLSGLDPGDPPCHAGANVLAVDPFGTVYPCLSLRTPCGSTREAPLADIWTSSPALLRLRDVKLADLEGCPTCVHRSFCDRCPGFAVSDGGSILDHVPFDCLQARIRHAGRIVANGKNT